MSALDNNLDLPPPIPAHLLGEPDAPEAAVLVGAEDELNRRVLDHIAARQPVDTDPMIPIAPVASLRERRDLLPPRLQVQLQQLLAHLPGHSEKPEGPEWPWSPEEPAPAPRHEHRRHTLLQMGQVVALLLTLAGVSYGVLRNTSSTPPPRVPVTSAAPTATTPPLATPTPAPPKSTPTPRPTPQQSITEQVANEFADEYNNPNTMTVDGVTYNKNDLVPVACVYISKDSANALPQGGGVLYRLPNGKYVLANDFVNGGSRVDSRVPICGDSPEHVLAQYKALRAQQQAERRATAVLQQLAALVTAAA